MPDSALPSPLMREEIARIEVGRTAVTPAVARALVAFFLTAIAAAPLVEVFARQRITDVRGTAWLRLAELPERVRAADTGVSSAIIGTPGPWNRTVAANRAALAGMAAFEDALEEESMLGRLLRPPAQYVLSGWLRAGNERVYVGREGWLFYRPDVEYVTGAPFLHRATLERRTASSKEWDTPPQPDPRTAILHFHRQLAQRGITLILVPTPVKASIHPEKLARAARGLPKPLQNASYASLIEQLRAEGVLVFDPADVLAGGSNLQPQYLAADTHWRPEAMEVVAEELAAFLREQVALAEVPRPGYAVREQDVSNAGDTAVMLDLPAGQQLYPPEHVWIRRVLEPNGEPWRSRRNADVLVLGDSFSNIYSLASLGWGESAGLAEQVGYVLQRPVDRLVQNDDGAFATRELLRDAGAERLAGKRVVVWQFAARELTIGDWRIIDLPR